VSRRQSCLLALGVAALTLGTAGCEPTLAALTTPPPGREAELDTDSDAVRLSEGVALAIECREQSGPCTGLAVESDDPAVADARAVYRDELATSTSGPRSASAFVVVGRRAGQTRVRLSTDDGSRSLEVEVIAAP
jgi:hypothetical protein